LVVIETLFDKVQILYPYQNNTTKMVVIQLKKVQKNYNREE